MLERAVVVFLGIGWIGCGSSQVTPTSPAGAQNTTATPDAETAAVPTPEFLCQRARALRQEGCAPYDRMAPSLFEHCTVVDSIYIAGMQGCLVAPTCDEVQACSVHARRTGAPYRGPTAQCEGAPRPTIPAGFSAAEIARSYGATDHRYSDSPSSKERPIEVCGFPAQSVYLLRLTCDDGSRPFASRDEAARARVGNVGEGGRCGRIIDHYEVPCPERTYDVYIDAYRCPA